MLAINCGADCPSLSLSLRVIIFTRQWRRYRAAFLCRSHEYNNYFTAHPHKARARCFFLADNLMDGAAAACRIFRGQRVINYASRAATLLVIIMTIFTRPTAPLNFTLSRRSVTPSVSAWLFFFRHGAGAQQHWFKSHHLFIYERAEKNTPACLWEWKMMIYKLAAKWMSNKTSRGLFSIDKISITTCWIRKTNSRGSNCELLFAAGKHQFF